MALDPSQHPPLIGILPAGQPLITAPTSQPTPTSFLYAIARTTTPANPKPFAHLAVFLLPGAALPDGAAAAIYLAQNGEALLRGEPVDHAAFRFLGGVGPGKESAVFKLNNGGSGGHNNNINNNGSGLNGGGDNSNNNGATGGIVIGVSLEPAASVAERIQQQQQQQQRADVNSGSRTGGPQPQPSTQVLAQRIIQNAYNFLSSFSGQVGEGGVEVVPLRAFQEWWRKFEGRVRSDPTFLEREQD